MERVGDATKTTTPFSHREISAILNMFRFVRLPSILHIQYFDNSGFGPAKKPTGCQSVTPTDLQSTSGMITVLIATSSEERTSLLCKVGDSCKYAGTQKRDSSTHWPIFAMKAINVVNIK